MRCVITAMTCLALLSACEFRRTVVNTPLQQEDVSFIVSGETTVSEVVDRLGAPDEVTGSQESDDRMLFRYRFRSTKTMRVNFGWIFRIFFVPFTPPMHLGRGDTQTDFFQVAFDANWISQESAFSHATQDNSFNFWPFRFFNFSTFSVTD